MRSRIGKRRWLAASIGAGLGLAAVGGSTGAAVGAPVERAENGSVTIDLGGDESAIAVARQPGGKLVLVGATRFAGTSDAVMSRLNPNGTLDTTFAGDGTRTLDLGGSEAFDAVAVQSDGKILAAGFSNGALVCRFNPDGTLDPTFDGDGVRTVDSGIGARIHDLAVQPDGKVVAAGSTTINGDGRVYRFNADGSLDPSFDGDGTRSIDSGGFDEIRAAALQRDGRIVLAAHSVTATAGEALAYRLTTSGAMDTTFDGDGTKRIAISDNASGEQLHDVTVQGDGKLLLAGGTNMASQAAVHRLNPSGALDASFDGDGTKAIPGGGNDIAGAVAVQPDGKIVVAGSAGLDPAAHRLNADGTPDATFGVGGSSAVDFGGTEGASDMVLQPDGGIVLAGGRVMLGNLDVLALRFDADGGLDRGFDSDGAVAIDSGGTEQAEAAMRQSDGKIVLAGFAGGDAAVYRLNPADGTLDTTFDGDGEKRIDGGGVEGVFAAGLQADGKIVLAGRTSVGGGDVVVYRLNANGALDPTFDGDGVKTIDSGGDEHAFALAVQRDGRIVVAGDTSAGGGDVLVHRLDANGALDAAFGVGGTRRIDSGGNDHARGVAVQRDGRIAVAGFTTVGANAVVHRLTSGGALDPTFDGDGTKTIDGGGTEAADAVAVQLDNKIVVAGRTSVGDNAAVHRLNLDGSFDATFDGDGAKVIDNGGVEDARAVAIQNNGKIVVAGHTSVGNDAAAYRVNADGSLDSAFDLDGARGHDNGGTEQALAIALQPNSKIVIAGHTTVGGNTDSLAFRLNENGTPDTTFDDGVRQR